MKTHFEIHSLEDYFSYFSILIFIYFKKQLNSEDVEDDENENLTPNATTISTEPIPQSPQGETTTPESTNQAAGNTEELNDAPPPYEPASGETANLITPAAPTSQEDLLNLSPPLYSEIVKLPTYNESQNIESDNEEPQGLNRVGSPHHFKTSFCKKSVENGCQPN